MGVFTPLTERLGSFTAKITGQETKPDSPPSSTMSEDVSKRLDGILPKISAPPTHQEIQVLAETRARIQAITEKANQPPVEEKPPTPELPKHIADWRGPFSDRHREDYKHAK